MEEDDTKIRADTFDSLASIRAQCRAPILSKLLDIQGDKAQPKRSLIWIKNLECLYRIDSREPDRKRRRGDNGRITERRKELLGRRCINPLTYSKRNYVAVSYTWEPSINEDTTVDGYCVESRQTQDPIPSKVRNVVLDRVTKYVEYCESELFWIDMECIDQNDPKKKEAAIQSMDQVYSLSDFPVGLLSVQIESEEHMSLLTELLCGEFVRDEKKTSSTEYDLGISPRKAQKALTLLELLTSDPWWTRAWTFQEDYRSSIKMTLLISHHPSLEDQKRDARGVLGDLPGEICVKSADFRTEATKFCVAYQKVNHGRQHEGICQNILKRAGKYTILLPEKDKPMSPIIFEDIGVRGITKDSDRLAVAANCCGYSVRLNTEELRIKECSLSLSMLALYLLNGEIVMNDSKNNRAALSDNIFDFLKKQSLNNFRPPVEGNELTFIKSCRFLNVELSEEGIETAGHFWKLGKMITRKFSNKMPYEIDSSDGLGRHQRWRLRQLADTLKSGKHGKRYTGLAKDIDSFLKEDAHLEGESFSKQYKDLMAEEVIQAIEDGKGLRLACLVPIDHKQQSKSKSGPYRGIFVSDAGGESEGVPSYVFTASCSASKNSGEIDKHVSLEVDLQGSASENRPRLITRRWINGLCFFNGCPQRKVVFPWPASMTE